MYTSLDSKHCYYYLGSRFYSPLLSRFMNADSMSDTGTGVVGTNMFAYCNNSPVGFIDPKGYAFEKILPLFSRLALAIMSILSYNSTNIGNYERLLAIANWISNSKKDKEISSPFIYNQHFYPFSDYKVGVSKFKNVGCEIVAVYNIYMCFEKKVKLSDLIFDFELYGLVMAGGTLGSNSNRIDRYFVLKNIKYDKYYNLSTLEKSMKKGDKAIISFWNENGIGLHTVAFFQIADFFVVLNRYGNSTDETNIFYSINDIVSSRNKFIAAYIVKDIG